MILVEIFSSRETNNSDLRFFGGTLMIYGENVRVANLCVGLSYYCKNDHSELFELLSDATHWEANQLVCLLCIVWNSHQAIKS